MSRRTLTDEQWERIAEHPPGRDALRGRSGVDNRLFVDAILWMAGNAARWRDLSEAFGKWSGVHARFSPLVARWRLGKAVPCDGRHAGLRIRL
ncbi:transposase [Sphingomonas sp. SORGH_AS 950]|nr:transposase [Sphingomonas sp. SORGH_AS_0950]